MLDIFRNEPELVTRQPGEFLFRPGDDSMGRMFAIVEGEIEISKDGRIIGTLGPGELLGEMALFDGGPRGANAKALTPVKAAMIGEKRFTFLVQQHPAFALDMLRMLTRRIRDNLDS